jgi:glycosyltransferase involved in cell wall biosynthesis
MWYVHTVNNEPKLGIVIAAYNAELFLTKTLESIRDISYKNFQCIIINDGSSDSTGTIASSFAASDDRFSVITIKNSGPCIARNHGYDSLGDDIQYVVFTDADDVILSDTYTRFIDILERDQGCVAAHGLGTFIDEHDQVDTTGSFEGIGLARKTLEDCRIVDLNIKEPTTFESLVLSSTVFPPGLVVHRKSILDQSGLFDPECRYAEDWDLLLRVTRYGYMNFVPDPVLYYRRHQNNVGTSPQVPLVCKRVWTKTFSSTGNSSLQSAIMSRALVAKNSDERRLYVEMLVSGIRNFSRPKVLRGFRGIVGTTIRLLAKRP